MAPGRARGIRAVPDARAGQFCVLYSATFALVTSSKGTVTRGSNLSPQAIFSAVSSAPSPWPLADC